MPEALTCACGGQTWQIHGAIIRCMSCQFEYRLSEVTWPRLIAFDISLMNAKIRLERALAETINKRTG